MRAFIYCRVSTEEQAKENHYSLKYQEDKGRQRADQEGWQVYKVRKDVGSGSATEHRDGYQELLTDVKQQDIDVVLVYKLDRLSRNVRDVYDFIELTKKHSVGFVSLTEGFDTTTPMGKAQLGMAAVFSQLTRETIAENVRNGLAERARSGSWVGGVPPFGYDYQPQAGLQPDPEEAPTLRRVFKLYTKEKLGMAKIAHLLNAQGVGTRSGSQWSTSTIQRILINPVYTGRLRHNGDIFEGDHEGLISSETFEQAQKIRNSRQKFHPRRRTSKLLLGGLARCGHCGWRLYSRPQSGGQQRYTCRGNQKVGEGACSGFVKKAEWIEEPVIAKLREVANSKEIQQLAVQEVEKLLEEELEPLFAEKKQITEQLAGISESFDQWAARLDRGIIDEEQFQRHNEALLKRKASLRDRLETIQQELAGRDRLEADLAEVKELLQDFDALWAQGTLEERKELVRALVEDLRVTKEKAVIKLRFLPAAELPLQTR